MTNMTSSKRKALTSYDDPFELFNWIGPTQFDLLSSECDLGRDSAKKAKVAKNDIRRFIPKMFQDAINGGNFKHMQTFADTFISPKCHVAAFFNVPLHFHIPSQVSANGSLQFGHYILGHLIMFPDMVITLSETSILSSPDRTGSKIIMDVEYSLTKTAHIPYELWIPSLDLIESLYRADTGWQLLHIIRHPHLYRSPAAVAATAVVKEECKDLLHSYISACDYSMDSYSSRGSSFSRSDSISSSISGSCTSSGGGGGSSALVASTPTRVPDRFSRALYDAAAALYQPLALQLRGQLTFHLDEANHIVLMETHMTAV